MAMVHRLVFKDGVSLAIGDVWPDEEVAKNGWTVGAMFLVYEELDPGEEDDAVAVTVPSHYRVFAQPPQEKAESMTPEEPSFYLDVPYELARFALNVTSWDDVAQQIRLYTSMAVEESEPMVDQAPPAPAPAPPAPAQQQQPTG